MGDSNQKDQEQLRATARERVERGVLPRRKALRTWGGHGSGLPCSLCDTAILPSEPEMELEFEPGASNQVLRFHLQCQSAWEAARRAPARESWVPVERELPPFGHVVEARLSVGRGEKRRLTLTIVRVPGSSADLWLNAANQEPLPATWRLLEWRTAVSNPPPAAGLTSEPKQSA